MGKRTIQVQKDTQAVVAFAAETIVEAANQSTRRADGFSIALSDGDASIALYDLLISDAFRSRIDWPQWEIYFTDERCVAATAPASSFRCLSEALLDQVPVKPENIHRMKGELEAKSAAIEYGRMLKKHFADDAPDIVLLELGGKGEIAGLFPQTSALDETDHRCVENQIDTTDWRITISAPFINRAAMVIVMAAGAEKAAVVAQALEGDRDPRISPAQLIDPLNGELLWLMDAGAAGMNDEE